jgi:hypothetical protein
MREMLAFAKVLYVLDCSDIKWRDDVDQRHAPLDTSSYSMYNSDSIIRGHVAPSLATFSKSTV